MARLQRRERLLAVIAFLGIPAQARLGGVTVLTDLNPWAVGGHLLLSMALIAVTYALWWRLAHPDTRADPDAAPPASGAGQRGAVVLSRLVALTTAVVLALGTVVTGRAARTPATSASTASCIATASTSAAAMSQLHADAAVMVLIGLTVGLVVLVTALRLLRRGAAGPRRPCWSWNWLRGLVRLRAVLHPPAGRPGRGAHARGMPGLAGRAAGALRDPRTAAGAGAARLS